jgi:ABC-type sulfate/molybdate transport systems ATPase subunit
MLELRTVSRQTGRVPLLSQASLAFTRDTPTAVLGLSAEGREGLIRLLSGVDKPQAGTVKLDGKDVSQARRDKGRIVRAGVSNLPRSGQKISKLIGVSEAARVRLSERMNAGVGDLDAEQRARLAIAVARSGKPALILLEAPADGLEREVRDRFAADLGAMLADTGAVVVLVAGSADEAIGLGARAVVLDDGVVVQDGPAEDVASHPATLASALATSFPTLNTLSMTLQDGRALLQDGSSFSPPADLPMPGDGVCTLAFRPEDTTLERAGAGCLRFVVREAGAETVGGRPFMRVSFAGTTWLTPQLAAQPPAGAVLNAFVDRGKLMTFDASGRSVV